MAAGGDFVEMLAMSGAGDGEHDVACSVGLFVVAGTGAGNVDVDIDVAFVGLLVTAGAGDVDVAFVGLLATAGTGQVDVEHTATAG